ncbi:OLC1v1026997C1 [Oldenlandia corymbosa var. corymbosa]|uniref:OLC1v1026997C1 n=1 Tax=Oldenlandia corymbosa var. corymbosa TaxID=529605 RepID=A0AAV1C8E9_OLDCO|nr:OLC1v1026997C1 [Oldenlandia corymbosa var. corymbosa]
MQLAAKPLLLRPNPLPGLRMLTYASPLCIFVHPDNNGGFPDRAMRPAATRDTSYCKNPNLSILSNSKTGLSNSQNFPQLLSPIKCFSSSSSAMNAIPISNSLEPKIGNTEASNDVVPDSLLSPLVVVSFYKFADFPDHADLRKPLKELCERLRVSGGIILAPEGINGSICGTRDSVENVLSFIQADDRLKGVRRVETPVSPEEEAIHHGHMSASPLAAGEDAPFRWDHVRVKLKKEIVTLGMPSVSPIERVGEYVSPRDWNALVSDPDVVVIDVRNDYETRIGKFKGAVDPCTTAFRDFPSWVEDRFGIAEGVDQGDTVTSDGSMEAASKGKGKLPRVAMYCTGGIRCEKASSYLLSKGFEEVYHLKGGILKYLEEVPKAESLWEGECFVFDKRVSVEHGLVQGTFKLCYGCKQPVSDADMESPEWEYGVSCPYCYSSKSEEEKERARARQSQFERWGIIGGPDKGRRPTSPVGRSEQKSNSA